MAPRAIQLLLLAVTGGAETAAGIAADGCFCSIVKSYAYFGYLNSGAAFSASLVVFIEASHLSFLLS